MQEFKIFKVNTDNIELIKKGLQDRKETINYFNNNIEKFISWDFIIKSYYEGVKDGFYELWDFIYKNSKFI